MPCSYYLVRAVLHRPRPARDGGSGLFVRVRFAVCGVSERAFVVRFAIVLNSERAFAFASLSANSQANYERNSPKPALMKHRRW